MDWNSIVFKVLEGVIGLVFLVLGAYVTYLIDKYVKNEQLKQTINSFRDLVRSSVLETYQKYVQELKDKNIFDAEAQETALSACLTLIKVNMPDRVKTWLTGNVEHVDKYIKDEIEAQIGALKNSGKKGG